MTDINEEQVDQLVDTLGNLPLEKPQRKLLDAILWVAADIKERSEEDEEQAFSSEFSHAFKKAHADLVLEYVAAAHHSGNMIIRTVTSPPSIIRNPPTPPGPDDDN